MKIKIKALKLRTFIGIHEWEQNEKQDVVIHIDIDFDGKKAGETDKIEDTVNYKSITKEIISFVESNRFFLLEKLGTGIRDLVMKNKNIKCVVVEVEKPGALRFSDTVSVMVDGS
jgi:D-erythro-7,8-dihydroneopterin triphosphate epimerase